MLTHADLGKLIELAKKNYGEMESSGGLIYAMGRALFTGTKQEILTLKDKNPDTIINVILSLDEDEDEGLVKNSVDLKSVSRILRLCATPLDEDTIENRKRIVLAINKEAAAARWPKFFKDFVAAAKKSILPEEWKEEAESKLTPIKVPTAEEMKLKIKIKKLEAEIVKARKFTIDEAIKYDAKINEAKKDTEEFKESAARFALAESMKHTVELNEEKQKVEDARRELSTEQKRNLGLVKELRDEIAIIKEENRSLDERYKASLIDNAALRTDLISINRELAERNDTNSDLEEKIEKLTEQKNSAEARLATEKLAIKQLEDELRAELAAHKTAAAKLLIEEKNTAQTERLRFQDAKSAMDTNLEKIRKNLSEKDAVIEDLRRGTETTALAAANQQKQFVELQTRLQNQVERVERLEREVKASQLRLTAETKKTTQKEEELTAAKAKIEELTGKLNAKKSPVRPFYPCIPHPYLPSLETKPQTPNTTVTITEPVPSPVVARRRINSTIGT